MAELKISSALTCSKDSFVGEIAKLLKEKKERRIFVVDKDNHLEGIITTTDLVYKVLVTSNLDLKAKDIMTKKVKFVKENEAIEKILHVMNETKSFVCPIVSKEGKFLGIVNYHQVINFLVG